MTQPRTRQELYDLIRQTSKKQYILEEMVRLGFWGGDQGEPKDPAKEVKRRGEIERRLKSLGSEASRLQNREKAIAAARKERMAESRRKRAESRQARIQAKRDRAAAWARRKAEELLYLGPRVSYDLNDTDSDLDRLEARGLPLLNTPLDLASAMGITLGGLSFLAYDRKVSRQCHYRRFHVTKKSGGLRMISAPMSRLKRAQRWILDEILAKGWMNDAAHGFRAERSILTNAAPHVGKPVVVNLDLADFFPTVTYGRVRGLFERMGYSPSLATVFALLTTEADIQEVELDGRTWYVRSGARRLPQGAPSSPGITNLLCRRLDARLQGYAAAHGWTYTRYADDLTFSGPDEDVSQLLWVVGKVIEDEGFTVHPDKTRVLRRGRRQEVTGIVVNDKLSVPRRELRKFRALLHQIEKDGPAGKRWGASDNLFLSASGFAEFVCMVDPDKGAPLRDKVEALRARYGADWPNGAPQGEGPTSEQAAPVAAPEPEPTPAPEPEPTPEPEVVDDEDPWSRLF